MNIAVIITAYNRKNKTLSCLRNLYANKHKDINFSVYLTDDGSTDGTSESVKEEFPDVIISRGNGNLYWSGGTNFSWAKAVTKSVFDGYILLNDDTVMLPNYWEELIEIDNWCMGKYGIRGIYVGATKSPNGDFMTYSGSISEKKWRSRFKMLVPNGKYQKCDTACANIIFIGENIVKKIGILHKGYKHGIADYDYTLLASRKGFPVFLMRDFVGLCENDHKSLYDNLINKKLSERLKYLYSPTGLQFENQILFNRRFFPFYVPGIIISCLVKTLFPKILKNTNLK